jgi:hypothetical protein
MFKDELPTYAIVELLIRLSDINPQIGNYKDHHIQDSHVIVKTTHGYIRFPHPIVMQQFNNPDLITEQQLTDIAETFTN